VIGTGSTPVLKSTMPAEETTINEPDNTTAVPLPELPAIAAPVSTLFAWAAVLLAIKACWICCA
jgi:hypothetical protein